jgi:hypothetical protein
MKHPYHETLEEKIGRWARTAVVEGNSTQQLALMSLLYEISEAAGKHGDVEDIVNLAMYSAFKETESLHDDAIQCVVLAGEEDRAELTLKKRRAANGGAQ